jgi:hypothetical protein
MGGISMPMAQDTRFLELPRYMITRSYWKNSFSAIVKNSGHGKVKVAAEEKKQDDKAVAVTGPKDTSVLPAEKNIKGVDEKTNLLIAAHKESGSKKKADTVTPHKKEAAAKGKSPKEAGKAKINTVPSEVVGKKGIPEKQRDVKNPEPEKIVAEKIIVKEETVQTGEDKIFMGYLDLYAKSVKADEKKPVKLDKKPDYRDRLKKEYVSLMDTTYKDYDDMLELFKGKVTKVKGRMKIFAEVQKNDQKK